MPFSESSWPSSAGLPRGLSRRPCAGSLDIASARVWQHSVVVTVSAFVPRTHSYMRAIIEPIKVGLSLVFQMQLSAGDLYGKTRQFD